ncbi:MAG: nucleotidyl transferase AbiEii/AbiGii toxin family protein [Planctomycetota bacterium]|nr:MAG: nucleotidyl transferase AbiEii/AbiGii toxin family protein [Planctomycetota bacterium]
MAKSFENAAAFRTSLEQRLKTLAKARGMPMNSLRLKVVIERLLARLFARPAAPWLLKGGYAMELRYRPTARTTKDIDLGIADPPAGMTAPARLDAIRDELQEAAELDLGDFLQFRISSPSNELQGAPQGGGRFPVEVLLAGKTYARFHIDIGIGDVPTGQPERLIGEDVLAFAGVRPAEVLAIPKAQQFAEKIHAYTFPWTDRPNTRTKDIIDLIMLIQRDPPSPDSLRQALRLTFNRRGTHPLPTKLPKPPEAWQRDFELMAKETELPTRDMSEGFAIVERFWNENELGAT